MRVLVALATLVLLTGCSVNVPALGASPLDPLPGGAVTEAVVGPAGSLNPLFEQTDNDHEIDSLIYQGLTTVGPADQVRMELASRMTVSADGLTYSFDLKRGVRWADGYPLTIDDVMFTFQTLQSPQYSVPTQQFWKDIQISAAGTSTVRFTLKAPSASFPLSLRQGIVPQHVFGRMNVADMPADPASAERAMGTGPFRVQSISPDRREVVLVRNPHADPKPHLDSFVFRSYASLGDAVNAVAGGEADAVGAVDLPIVPSLARRPDLVLHEIQTFDFVAAVFNVSADQAATLDPPALRQGLARAIDRRRIVDQTLGGRADPECGPIPPTVWAYSAQDAGALNYDPVAAARLLDQAGWPLDPLTGMRTKDGKVLTLTMVTEDGYPYKQVAEELQREFRQVGVELVVEPVSLSSLVSQHLLGKQFQVALAAVDNGPDPDQFTLWHSGAPSDSLNFSGPLMPHQALIDKSLEDGRAGTDQRSRMSAYLDFQSLMAQAAPAVFLFEPHYAYLISKRVRGVHTNPAIEPVDRLQFVADWYVNTKGMG